VLFLGNAMLLAATSPIFLQKYYEFKAVTIMMLNPPKNPWLERHRWAYMVQTNKIIGNNTSSATQS